MPVNTIPNRFHGLLLMVMLAITITAYVRIPAHLNLPVHWSRGGDPDWLWPKNDALLVMPAVGVFVVAVFWAVGRSSRSVAFKTDRQVLDQTLSAVLALLAAIQFGLLLIGIGSDIELIRLITLGMAVVLFVVGNELRKAEPNAYGGPRLPWTIKDQARWRRQHRMAGVLFMLSGLGLGFAAWLWPAPGTLIVVLLVAAVLPATLGALWTAFTQVRTG